MYIRKRNGRYTVEIHKQGFKRIIKTFAQKSDARKFGIDTEVQMERKRYKDISNASKTTLRAVLERHLQERMKDRSELRQGDKFGEYCLAVDVSKIDDSGNIKTGDNF